MNFSYYGHSCFSVQIRGKHLLFDPFITSNTLANNLVDVDSIAADYILLSHGHADHFADCVRIAARTEAQVICSWEIHEWLNKQQIMNTHPMNTGGKWDFGEFVVKCVVAHHSSSLFDGTYAGNPMGFVITSEEGNFYYAGDTALTLDMQLIPKWAKLNFAVLPIGDNFTMDAQDASECAHMIECNKIVGCHYDTFGFVKIDHQQAKKTFSDRGMNLILAKIGETFSI